MGSAVSIADDIASMGDSCWREAEGALLDKRLSNSPSARFWARAAANDGLCTNSRVDLGLLTGVLMNWTSLRILAMLSDSFEFAFAMSFDADDDDVVGVLVVFMPSNMEARGFGCVSVVWVGLGSEGALSVA
jgi:hypothetical protein